MTPERFRMAESIFRRACDMSAIEQQSFVQSACGDDGALLSAVRLLLQHDARPDGAFESPLGGAIRQYGEALFGEAEAEGPLPTQIGPYRVLRRIGEGGFGIVYRAEQSNPRRVVALKLLRTPGASRDLLRRFEYEAHILGRLQHPGIAQIFEAGVASINGVRQPFYAMEFIAGNDIVTFARENNLAISERLALFAQMCDALQHAHQRGVIHRDLKPANILVSDEITPAQDGNRDSRGKSSRSHDSASPHVRVVKVLDFGVARLMEQSGPPSSFAAPHTSDGQLIGTLAYMSPEQIAGDADQIDTRSDVYSAGVLLFELLTDRLPYDVREQGLAHVARVISEQPPTSISAMNRALRGDVQAIVEKALQKEKSRRYQSAADFAADIRRYLAGEPIEAKRDSALYLLRKNAQRYRGVVAATALLVLALGVFNAILFQQARENRRLAIEAHNQRNRAGAEAENLRHALYFSRITNAQTAILLQNDPARATWMLDLAPTDLRGWEWRHLKQLIDQSRRAIPAPGVRPGCATLSGDDRLLCAVNMEGIITLWDFASGRRLFEMRPPSPRARVLLNRDGTMLVIGDDNGEITLFDVSSASVFAMLIPPYELDEFKDREVRKIAFADNEQTLISISRSGRVSIWDIASRSMRGSFLTQLSAQTFTMLQDETKLLVGGTDGHLTLWDLSSRQLIRAFEPYDNAILAIDYSPHLDLVAITTERGLHTLDTRTGMDREIGPLELDAITWAEFTADGHEIIVGGRDRVLYVYNARTRERRRVFRGHTAAISYCTMSHDGCWFVTGDRSQGWRIWDFSSQQDIPTIECEQHMLQSLAFSPDSALIATGGNSGDIKLWDRDSLTLRRRIDSERDTVHALCFSTDGSEIAAARGKLPTRIHDVMTGRTTAEFAVPPRRTSGVAFSRDASLIVEADSGGYVSAYRRDRLQPVWTRQLHPADKTVVRAARLPVTVNSEQAGAAIQIDNLIASTGGDGVVNFLSETGDIIRSFRATPYEILDLAFSPDCKSIATVDRWGGVRTWNVSDSTLLIECAGHRGPARGCAFSPDGRRLVTCGADAVLRVWDTSTRDEVITLSGAKRTVECVAFSPDGRTIISGGEDFVLRVWDSTEPLRRLPLSGEN